MIMIRTNALAVISLRVDSLHRRWAGNWFEMSKLTLAIFWVGHMMCCFWFLFGEDEVEVDGTGQEVVVAQVSQRRYSVDVPTEERCDTMIVVSGVLLKGWLQCRRAGSPARTYASPARPAAGARRWTAVGPLTALRLSARSIDSHGVSILEAVTVD
eukprot:COSAG01_NODE_1441_length_10293_cov_4.232392_11_plen_156_part_00